MPEPESREITYSLPFNDYVTLMHLPFGLNNLFGVLTTTLITALMVVPYFFCRAFEKICLSVHWPIPYLSLIWPLWNSDLFTNFLVPGFIFLTVYSSCRILSAWKIYSSNKVLFDNVSATLTPECLITKASSMESRFEWVSVLSVSQNKALIMCKITNVLFVAIPKRAFKRAEDAAEFFEYALNCWKTAQKKH